LAELAKTTPLNIVSGYFDPVWAPHAERLEELATHHRPLVILLRDPPDPLLPADCRAELLAGLASVDYVCVTNGDAVEPIPAATMIREEETDLARRRMLVEQVRKRHQKA
jgi:hypothetical protein